MELKQMNMRLEELSEIREEIRGLKNTNKDLQQSIMDFRRSTIENFISKQTFGIMTLELEKRTRIEAHHELVQQVAKQMAMIKEIENRCDTMQTGLNMFETSFDKFKQETKDEFTKDNFKIGKLEKIINLGLEDMNVK